METITPYTEKPLHQILDIAYKLIHEDLPGKSLEEIVAAQNELVLFTAERRKINRLWPSGVTRAIKAANAELDRRTQTKGDYE